MNQDLLFWGLIWIGWSIVAQLKANMETQKGNFSWAAGYGIVSSICMLIAISQYWIRG